MASCGRRRGRWTATRGTRARCARTRAWRFRPFAFSRTVELDENEIRLGYQLDNLSAAEESFLWAIHPLLKLEPGDQLQLPASTRALLPGAAWIDDIDSAIPAGNAPKFSPLPLLKAPPGSSTKRPETRSNLNGTPRKTTRWAFGSRAAAGIIITIWPSNPPTALQTPSRPLTRIRPAQSWPAGSPFRGRSVSAWARDHARVGNVQYSSLNNFARISSPLYGNLFVWHVTSHRSPGRVRAARSVRPRANGPALRREPPGCGRGVRARISRRQRRPPLSTPRRTGNLGQNRTR